MRYLIAAFLVFITTAVTHAQPDNQLGVLLGNLRDSDLSNEDLGLLLRERLTDIRQQQDEVMEGGELRARLEILQEKLAGGPITIPNGSPFASIQPVPDDCDDERLLRLAEMLGRIRENEGTIEGVREKISKLEVLATIRDHDLTELQARLEAHRVEHESIRQGPQTSRGVQLWSMWEPCVIGRILGVRAQVTPIARISY